jgi:dihydroneopterin aldolase
MDARICIDELEVDCLIGCLDAERRTVQTVRVDLWVELDILQPAQSDALERTWNYAAIADQVDFILQAGQFWLLESACRVLLRWLLVPPAPGALRPAATAAGVSLTKFGVLAGKARPRVAVSGRAHDEVYERETNPWGTVDIIEETARLGLYRLNVAPGHTIPHHEHRRMLEQEMVLTDGLVGWKDGTPPRSLHAGHRETWPLRLPHGYRNPLPHGASILCMDKPRFAPDDEVLVPNGPSEAAFEGEQP